MQKKIFLESGISGEETLISGSMKGTRVCTKDTDLGTHEIDDNELRDQEPTKEIKWHEEAPTGKMDLVIDLNFRMDSIERLMILDIVLT